MLYIVYLPKVENESIGDRKILKMIKKYSKLTMNENSIICFPGYMSTGSNTIRKYINKFYNTMVKVVLKRDNFLIIY